MVDHLEESLSSAYDRAQQQASTSEATGDGFADALQLLQRCEQLIQAAGLFSANEEADDLHTEHLRYLLVPFLMAQLHEGRRTTDQRLRLQSASAAAGHFGAFLAACGRYGLLTPGLQRLHEAQEGAQQQQHDRQQQQQQQLDPSSLRTAKIEQAKRSATIQRLLQQLDQLKLRDQRADQESGAERAGPVGGAAGWDEEDERQLWMLKLEQAAIAAAASIPRLQQEIQICTHFVQQQQQSGPQATGRGSQRHGSAIDAAAAAAATAADAADAKAAMASRLRGIAHQLAGSERQRLAQQVFRPTVALPTLSVEQQGDIELREARERQQRGAAAARAAAAAEAGLTEEQREERERLKAAAWDEFKDDHPFGSGNSKLRPCAL